MELIKKQKGREINRLINADFFWFVTALSSLFFSSICSAQEPIFLNSFTTRAHQVAGDLYLVSERVLQIQNYVYDGTGPAAYFWLDANPIPSRSGRVVPDASPSLICALDTNDPPLEGANGITQNVELPEGMTIRDYLGGSLSVWCERFAVNFGEAVIPESISIPSTPDVLECFDDGPSPPTPSPVEDIPPISITPDGFNCEPLNDDYQVRWRVSGDNLDVELIGRVERGEYMGFGISGRPQTDTWMIGADAVVADMTESGPRVQDIFIDSRAQCNGVSGVCPDTEGGFTNDVSNISGEESSGLTLIRYSRPLVPTDNEALTTRGEGVDMTIPSQDTFIVWALGPMSTVGNPLFHSIDFPRNDVSLDFGRSIVDNCPPLLEEEETLPPATPFIRPDIGDPDGSTTFDCHIGPSGGPRGYEAITGKDSWGIAWYVNGYLVPKLVLRRGVTYTFRINGGDDPSNDAKYHPFYLTDSSMGGYFQLSPAGRLEENPLAGITVTDADVNGVYEFVASLTAPICEYKTTALTGEAELGPYEDYFDTLDTSCEDSAIVAQAAVLEFTPDDTTPDSIYYQCVTHFDLGYEIEVVGLDESEAVELTGPLAGATLYYRVNIEDPSASGEDTITVVLEVPDVFGWVGFAFNHNGGMMVGSEAVIGLPDTGDVRKYNLNAQAVSGVVPMPDERQTLIDASISQTEFGTTLRFTKFLIEDGEIPIEKNEINTFLSAWGSSNELAYHAVRGPYDVFLTAPVPSTSSPTMLPTESPTTTPPTQAPSTKSPTQTPTTSAPTSSAPVTSATTTSAPSGGPTKAPTQAPFTLAPTTSAPSGGPTKAPTQAPVTSAPPTSAPSGGPTKAPTQAPVTLAPAQTAPPTTLDEGGELFEIVLLTGRLEGATMSYRLNVQDPAAWGQDTMTVVLETPALGWVGFAFNDNGGMMVGSEAVIGLPDSGDVRKYDLSRQAEAGILPLPDEQQTLINASITQTSTGTTLRFTKILVEEGEIPVIKNSFNTFLSAWGSSNILGFHATRGPYTLMLQESGGTPAPAGPTQSPSSQSPVDAMVTPGPTEEKATQSPNVPNEGDVSLTGQLAGATLKYMVNPEDVRASGKDTVTIVLETPASGWVGFALNDNGGFMVGSEAVIGLPDTGEVKKYNLNDQDVSGVVPMADNRQTLIDASIIQTPSGTTLNFTKILVEDGEIPIAEGSVNTFLSAWGSSNVLGFHAAREAYNVTIPASPGPPTTLGPTTKSPTEAPVEEPTTASADPPVGDASGGSRNLGLSSLLTVPMIVGLSFLTF